jgi:hypothetical protein
MVSPDESITEDVKRTFSQWLFGQEANTVALFMILAAGAWAGHWAITIGIPAHLKQIQAGYETINNDNNKSREEDRKAREQDRSAFEKTMDRVEKAYKLHNEKSD